MSSKLIDRPDMHPQSRVIGFSGSPRRNGNSDSILKSILSGVAGEKVESDHFNLASIDYKGCLGCEKCRRSKICTGLVDGMSLIYPKLLSSRGLVLVSPTHNYNITSWMKAFIDRLYCFYNFENDRPRSWSSQLANQGRKAVVAAVCEQESAEDMGFTLEAMKIPLEALGYEIIGELSVFRVFDKALVKKDNQAMKKAHQLGKNLAQSIKSE